MKRSLTLLAVVIAVAAAGTGYWYVQGKQPQREGEVAVSGLQAPVSARYDARGVPHLQAQNEQDLYRALGYVHAQDRLFQMEIMRRLAQGNWPKCWARSWYPPTPCSAACASVTRPR